MILRKIALSLVGGAFVVISTLSSLTAQADPASISTAPVVFIAPGFPPVAGASSKIVRNDNGVTVSVKTTVDPGTYTMWMVLWNEGSPMDGPPDCVLFTAGHVVGNNGTLNYSGHRRVYDSSGSIVEEGVPGPPCASGLTNPQGAEIHLVIRSHGPKQPGQVNLQISTLLGGCLPGDLQISTLLGGCLPGDPADPCVDVQAAIHPLKP
jgi:hypothetical protein